MRIRRYLDELHYQLKVTTSWDPDGKKADTIEILRYGGHTWTCYQGRYPELRSTHHRYCFVSLGHSARIQTSGQHPTTNCALVKPDDVDNHAHENSFMGGDAYPNG